MPLSAYEYRPLTPPAAAVPELDFLEPDHSPSFSESSTVSGRSYRDTLHIRVSTTPYERSPIRQHGPTLLPKIRTQDQSIRTPCIQKTYHRRAVSQSFVPPSRTATKTHRQRSTTVPPEPEPFTPASAISTSSASFPFLSPITPVTHSNINSPITIVPPSRPSAGHHRSTSASYIPDSVFKKSSYYTYQSYVPSPTAYWTRAAPGTSIYTAPARYIQDESLLVDLPEEQQCTDPTEATMKPLDYMRQPNPTFELVRTTSRCMSKVLPHFWWDIRNLSDWDDFNLETIMGIDGFERLLNMPVPDNDISYPKPRIDFSRRHPETTGCLVDIIRDFYITKLNALMKITQGTRRYMGMRVNKDKDGPTFFSNYQDDVERTIIGGGRGRLVGIALPWNRWNVGKRYEPGYEKMLYLDGLAMLQHHMRANQCRYGFIMNETELICVRAGTNDVPFFGHLELSPVIESRTQDGLTTCLALWYITMLAKEQPLPDQHPWNISVGSASAMTRQLVMPAKDDWIPKPTQGEMRIAKRLRGWIWPQDPYNKKREGKKAK